jgi:uncharacterized membrane protein
MPVTPPQPTSTGLDQNVAGLLSYVLGPLTGLVFFLLEKENRFVRFHAMQSIVVGVAVIAFWIVFSILSTILAFMPFLAFLGWVLTAIVSMVAWLAFFVLWIVLMVKAFQGEEWEVPMLGKYARQYSAPATVG